MRTRAAALLAALLVSGTVLAAPRSHDEAAAVPVGVPQRVVVAASPRANPDRTIVDVGGAMRPVPQGRPPNNVVPPPHLVVVPRSPQPTRPSSSGRSGVASFYCSASYHSRCTRGYPGGLYAAIRRDLLSHRGDQARVCSGSRCVTVTIIDCNCGPGANLIDLYADAFDNLAPLSRGRIPVTLVWL